MVGAALFEQVESRLRQIFDANHRFGGISLIAVGDFTQLKPVCDRYIFQGSKKNPYHAIAGGALWSDFKLYELDEIMRQKDDIPFARALQNFASCKLTADDISLLESRVSDDAPPDAIHLFASNAEVDLFNKSALEKLTTFGVQSEARDTCYGGGNPKTKEGYLNSLKDAKTSETGGLLSLLTLKVSAKYMITDNIDVEDGLVNGAIGTLSHISCDNSGTHAVIVWLKFTDRSVGSKAISGYKLNSHPATRNSVPIFRLSKLISNKGYHQQLQIYRSQFPLSPAEAITIHKSQGSTYDKVAYHISRYCNHSSAYVALSRATTAGGLTIVGTLKTFTAPNTTVIAELDRLRTRPAGVEHAHLLNKPSRQFKIVSFNVQSIANHVDCVMKDPCMNNADLMVFLETWTIPKDKLFYDNYYQVARSDSGSERKPSGILILARNGVACTSVHNTERRNSSYVVQASLIRIGKHIFVTCVYASPRTPSSVLGNVLMDCIRRVPEKRKLVLTGDFNIQSAYLDEIVKHCNHGRVIRNIMPSEGSTYLNKQIDLTLSDTTCFGEYYESFLSYHRPQILHVPLRKPQNTVLRRHRTMLSRRKFTNSSRPVLLKLNIRKRVKCSTRHIHFYRDYLRWLCRKRNRHKFHLPQHELLHLKLYALKIDQLLAMR